MGRTGVIWRSTHAKKAHVAHNIDLDPKVLALPTRTSWTSVAIVIIAFIASLTLGRCLSEGALADGLHEDIMSWLYLEGPQGDLASRLFPR